MSIDGMPRHILDVRRIILPSSSEESGEDREEERNEEGEEHIRNEESVDNEEQNESIGDGNYEEAGEHVEERRYPQRERRPPPWMVDYVRD